MDSGPTGVPGLAVPKHVVMGYALVNAHVTILILPLVE